MPLKIDKEVLKAEIRLSDRLPNPDDMEKLRSLLIKLLAEEELKPEETTWLEEYMPRFREHMLGILFPHSLDLWVVLIPVLIKAANSGADNRGKLGLRPNGTGIPVLTAE